MPSQIIDMDDPPQEFERHQELLFCARDQILQLLPHIESKGLLLDEIVVVAAEPELAATIGKPPVFVEVLAEVLARITDPDYRACLAAPQPHGFVRVVVFSGRSRAVLGMNVRAAQSSVLVGVGIPEAHCAGSDGR